MQLKKLFLFFVLLFAGLSAGTANAQTPISEFNPASLSGNDKPLDLSFHARAFSGANALPFRVIVGGSFRGPYTPEEENLAFYYWKTDLGVIHNEWRFAGYYRGEEFATANRDTIEFLRLTKLRQKLPVEKDYDIDFEIQGFSATGIEISRGANLEKLIPGLSAGITARYIYGTDIQEGTVTGNARTTSERTYDFNLLIDYMYDKNYVYDRKDTVPGNGHGYSFDFGLIYDFSERFRIEFLARDIAGRIYWTDVPYTTAEAGSQIKEFDESGYQEYRPTISGYEGERDLTQKIPEKYDFSLSYTEGPFNFVTSVNLFEGETFYWADVGYQISENSAIRAGYNFNYDAISLGLAYKRFSAAFYLSDIMVLDANAAGLLLTFQ